MGGRVKLLAGMLIKGALGFLLLGALLFGCAGTLRYVEAWAFLIALFALMLAMGIVLLLKHPETLARRLRTKEGERAQRGYIAVIGALFVASFVLAGLDQRFGWSNLPLWGALAALAAMVGGYALYGAVTLQNAWAARTVEVQDGQRVVTTGLYAVVRHPMYMACLLLFLSMPLALGSWVALAPMLAFPLLLAMRVKNEEALLAAGLPGYTDYMKKTKYRMVPFIW